MATLKLRTENKNVQEETNKLLLSTAYTRGVAACNRLFEIHSKAKKAYKEELLKTGNDYNPAEIVRLKKEMNEYASYYLETKEQFQKDFEDYKPSTVEIID